MNKEVNSFFDLGLKKELVDVLIELNYNKPSPIQIACIPPLLSGYDVLGIAQTGSGKTAAFALPLIQNINFNIKMPQMLILTPTRELAIQVGKACINFSKYIKNINTAILYGGQQYDRQLCALKNGSQIIVGTPGRLLDHLNRGTLNLSYLNKLIIDEADEMLRMGFIDNVKDILKKISNNRQTALFSATMPKTIYNIINKFMKAPKEINIQSNIANCPNIKQFYCKTHNINKQEVLMRFLEIQNFDAAIIFVKTKNITLKLSENLKIQGYKSEFLNGDMTQILREKTINNLKNGNINILIATDIAARGLDIERITLVINYDIPSDYESYIHRIGRTGRAGKEGYALSLIEYKELNLFYKIERNTRFNISEKKIPNIEELCNHRISNFIAQIKFHLEKNDLNQYKKISKKLNLISEYNIEDLIAVLIKLSSINRPLILPLDSIEQKIKYKNDKYNFNNKNNHIDLYNINIGKKDGINIHDIINNILVKQIKLKLYNIGKIKIFDNYSIIELLKVRYKDILLKQNKLYFLNKKINFKLHNKFNLNYKHNHNNK